MDRAFVKQMVNLADSVPRIPGVETWADEYRDLGTDWLEKEEALQWYASLQEGDLGDWGERARDALAPRPQTEEKP